MAREIGVSERTLFTWKGEGCPTDAGVDAIRDWRTENKHPRKGGIGKRTPGERLALAELDEAEQRARVRKLEEMALYLQLKNDDREKDLIDGDEVRRQYAEILEVLHRTLEPMPEEFAASLPADWPASLRAMITERMRDKVELILRQADSTKIEGITE